MDVNIVGYFVFAFWAILGVMVLVFMARVLLIEH